MFYIDKPRPVKFRRFKRTAHLLCTGSSAELLSFASSIGLKAEWLQKAGLPNEHFDLFDGAIDRARAAGAQQVSKRIIAELILDKRLRPWNDMIEQQN